MWVSEQNSPFLSARSLLAQAERAVPDWSLSTGALRSGWSGHGVDVHSLQRKLLLMQPRFLSPLLAAGAACTAPSGTGPCRCTQGPRQRAQASWLGLSGEEHQSAGAGGQGLVWLPDLLAK